MDTSTKPANDADYTLRLDRREANPNYYGPVSLNNIVVSLPPTFPRQAARIRMDNVLWNAGLGKYSVCPVPRLETEREWITRLVKENPPRLRDATGRFISREVSPQAELPLPSSLSELNAQLARVKVPKRQSKRRPQ